MGCVLVVEDDHAICALISDVLGDAGLETLCVASDRDAYDIIPKLPVVLGLVVDVNLGAGTTGFDVARFARQIIPDLPVVYVSGEAPLASFRAFGVPESDFLEKPFAPGELLEKLQTRLAA
jgi:CheY-like chemotaxis protein